MRLRNPGRTAQLQRGRCTGFPWPQPTSVGAPFSGACPWDCCLTSGRPGASLASCKSKRYKEPIYSWLLQGNRTSGNSRTRENHEVVFRQDRVPWGKASAQAEAGLAQAQAAWAAGRGLRLFKTAVNSSAESPASQRGKGLAAGLAKASGGRLCPDRGGACIQWALEPGQVARGPWPEVQAPRPVGDGGRPGSMLLGRRRNTEPCECGLLPGARDQGREPQAHSCTRGMHAQRGGDKTGSRPPMSKWARVGPVPSRLMAASTWAPPTPPTPGAPPTGENLGLRDGK